MKVKCDNCGKTFDDSELKHKLEDGTIPHLLERIEPGGIVPSGECIDCGALSYPVHDAARTNNRSELKQRLTRKANQSWDMAGLARQDKDLDDEKRHTDAAREYERQAKKL